MIDKDADTLEVPRCESHCMHNPNKMISGRCQAWLTYVMDICGHRCEVPAPADSNAAEPWRVERVRRQESSVPAPASVPQHPDMYSPDAKHCPVCTQRDGRATFHLPPVCSAAPQGPGLKPCPFCSAKPEIEGKGCAIKHVAGRWLIECQQCSAVGPNLIATRDKAIIAWNTRPADADRVVRLKSRAMSVAVKPGRFGGNSMGDWMTVDWRGGMNGAKWAVCDKDLCLNHEGEWEWEPQPSSREDDFLTRCRFDSFDEAWEAAMRSTPVGA